MKLRIIIYFLLFIFSISESKCRNCGLVIDTSAQVNVKNFLEDTLHIYPEKIGNIGNFIKNNKKPYSVIVLIRIGDRQAWIQSTLKITGEIFKNYDNVSVAFIFLDTDSSLAERMRNTIIDRFNIQNFEVLYTQSYTEGESVAKIQRWNLQTTPAIIIFDEKNNHIIYPMTLDEKDAFSKINSIMK
ncbi:hypothetical protein J7L68_06690 [bacterium]|nr:hypothetical protein [bacterium]